MICVFYHSEKLMAREFERKQVWRYGIQGKECLQKKKVVRMLRKMPGMVVHVWEAGVGESQIQGKSGLHRETLSQKNQELGV
jgi:hypothetical protein